MYVVKNINQNAANQICQWTYPAPYDLYNLDEYCLEELIDPKNNYHLVYDEDSLLGFLCWGLDARVNGHSYCDQFTDVGLGMNPEFTGNGRGQKFVEFVLNYLRNTHQIEKVRFTVASMNERALKVYKSLKFDDHHEFENPKNHLKYKIMRLEQE